MKSSKRTRQREQLILALLQQPSLAKAAASIGMSSSTAFRISKTKEFQEEYLTARREAYSRTIARLQHGSNAAASVIFEVLADPKNKAQDRLHAADSVLNHSTRGMQTEDLAARVGRIEQEMKEVA